MTPKSKQNAPTGRRSGSLVRLVALAATCWTLAVAVSLFWSLHNQREEVLEVARTEARTAHQKDIVYRRWNAGHGGVYAPVTDTTQPNPHLEVAERDITTPSGRRLTLINPAFMTRQVHELAS